MNTTVHFDRQISRQMSGLVKMESPSISPSLSRMSSINRKHPLLQRSLSTPSPAASCGGGIGSKAAEVCGGTAAECAAVWCCCPCAIVNLLILAVYKVPAGICRRALRHRRSRKLTKNKHPPLPPSSAGAIGWINYNQTQIQIPGPNRCRCRGCRELDIAAVHPLASGDMTEDDDDEEEKKKERNNFSEPNNTRKDTTEEDAAAAAALAELEKEMWNRFYGTGFWRSPSQRESVSSPRTLATLWGPSPAVPSPRTSFTGVYRTSSSVRGSAASPRFYS